jgi:superfamily II DNA/RNA helicase
LRVARLAVTHDREPPDSFAARPFGVACDHLKDLRLSDQKTFTDFGVEAALVDALASQGIVHPFPIQELTLPLALKGADVIGQARTGTGKTLGFGLPLLQQIDPTLAKTQAVVIVPTRELCLQVADDLSIGSVLGVTSIAIYGGVGYDEQIDALQSGVHVVVGTPGRTLDHLSRRNLDLSGVRVVVLDEADEMLDMGFLPDVERLMSGLPEQRQTMLFSATMPAAIVKLARRFMHQPTFMRAESEERTTAPTVDQYFFLVHRMDKPRVLARLLQTDNRGGAFVFTRTKNMADRLVRELDDLNVKAIAVHGDLRQATREKNLDQFRAGKADVLVATEVAARGLDVDNVTHVVNYDCPEDEKMYLHRIGRTARAGGSGVAVTFAEFNEIDRLNVIRKAVQTDTEIVEVFSTSDALTTMFDLPDETPWDHMSRSSSGSRDNRGSSRGNDRTSSPRPSSSGGSTSDDRASSGGRRSSTAGRNQSRRDNDGSRPADRTRDRSPAKQTTRDADTASTTDRSRTRTRTRVRTTDEPGGGSGTGSRSDTGGSDTGSRSGDTQRTRARRTRASQPTEGSSGSKDTSGSRDTSGSSAERSGSKGGQSSGRSQDSGRSRSSGSGRSGGSGKGRSTGERSGDGTKGGRSTGPRDRTTPGGEPARGDGTPTPRRRVHVDHLP